ncbi:MAG: C-GCAxxG-C-C family protein [Coriobacteriaceae bacterium]|nr:C-GCAxxG-C-C family protein [Coriobacteriaceae bacterium]
MAVNQTVTKLDADQVKARAAELHAAGFNCAQSVVCALAPALDIDEDLAFRLAEGFGAGMGGMSETCGAISGAIMAAGALASTGRTQPTSKGATYKLSRRICEGFEQKNGSTICRTLKGVGSDQGPLRSCAGCIDDAIEMALEVLGL